MKKYTEIIADYDVLLTELECTIHCLNCAWWGIQEEEEGRLFPAETREIKHNSIFANIQHLERIYNDLQNINSSLWAVKKE